MKLDCDIQNFNIGRLRRMRHACFELLLYYRGNTDDMRDCPLCIFAIECNLNSCSVCPWIVFERMRCTEWLNKNFAPFKGMISDARIEKMPEFVAARIPMLERWIKLIDSEILKKSKEVKIMPYDIDRPQFVRHQHPYDGSPNAGKPVGPVLTVIKIADHAPPGGIREKACIYYLSDGTWAFKWNLYKVFDSTIYESK